MTAAHRDAINHTESIALSTLEPPRPAPPDAGTPTPGPVEARDT